MSYLRTLLRFILNISADSFNKAQEKELMELLKDQEQQADKFISDASGGRDAKVSAMAVLAEAIAKDTETLSKLKEK